MDNITVAFLLVLVILLIFYIKSGDENFTVVGDYAGVYQLAPLFDTTNTDPVIKMQIIPNKPWSPNYLILIFTYANGRTRVVKTNAGEIRGVYTVYNEFSHWLIRRPKNLEYQVNLNTGSVHAQTVVFKTESTGSTGKGSTPKKVPTIEVLQYTITKKIS